MSERVSERVANLSMSVIRDTFHCLMRPCEPSEQSPSGVMVCGRKGVCVCVCVYVGGRHDGHCYPQVRF